MSQRIVELLEVLDFVRNGYHSNMTDRALRELRQSAVEQTAEVRGILQTTVSNKFRRELWPEISGTKEFDASLQEWLRSDGGRLKNALLSHSVDHADEHAVRSFFDSQ